jgi:predicted glycosyltransferase
MNKPARSAKAARTCLGHSETRTRNVDSLPAAGSPQPTFASQPIHRLPHCRIAMYSHDTMGIGHVRRNLLIAQTLVCSCRSVSILLIAGAREASVFAMPPGVDCLTLPSLCKDARGSYEARRLSMGLEELIALRSRAIAAALDAFEPDALIVDKVPRGALDELEPALDALLQRGRTCCVLGLREVLDEPTTVRKEWDEAANEDAIRTYYDAVWVYGDPLVYDPVEEYRLAADVAAKVRYTGYFDQRRRLKFVADSTVDPLQDLALPPGRLVLGMVGGGEDGTCLAEALARADVPAGTNVVLITGPFMPTAAQARLRRQAARSRSLRVLNFLSEPDMLLRRADAVIAMGGYNTVSEILSFEKPSLLVPRVKPRQEQLIRAQRLRELGLVDMLHPDDVSPAALSAWLANTSRSRPHARRRLDFNGLSRLPHLLDRLLLSADPKTAHEEGNGPHLFRDHRSDGAHHKWGQSPAVFG